MVALESDRRYYVATELMSEPSSANHNLAAVSTGPVEWSGFSCVLVDVNQSVFITDRQCMSINILDCKHNWLCYDLTCHCWLIDAGCVPSINRRRSFVIIGSTSPRTNGSAESLREMNLLVRFKYTNEIDGYWLMDIALWSNMAVILRFVQLCVMVTWLNVFSFPMSDHPGSVRLWLPAIFVGVKPEIFPVIGLNHSAPGSHQSHGMQL